MRKNHIKNKRLHGQKIWAFSLLSVLIVVGFGALFHYSSSFSSLSLTGQVTADSPFLSNAPLVPVTGVASAYSRGFISNTVPYVYYVGSRRQAICTCPKNVCPAFASCGVALASAPALIAQITSNDAKCFAVTQKAGVTYGSAPTITIGICPVASKAASPPPPSACSSITHGTLCSGDDIGTVPATDFSLPVLSCTNQRKCEFTCGAGYVPVGKQCIAVPAAGVCVDSDSGVNGAVQGYGVTSGLVKVDSCFSATSMREVTCSNNQISTSNSFTCSAQQGCVNGMCSARTNLYNTVLAAPGPFARSVCEKRLAELGLYPSDSVRAASCLGTHVGVPLFMANTGRVYTVDTIGLSLPGGSIAVPTGTLKAIGNFCPVYRSSHAAEFVTDTVGANSFYYPTSAVALKGCLGSLDPTLLISYDGTSLVLATSNSMFDIFSNVALYPTYAVHVADVDVDRIADGVDNCVNIANPTQTDTDRDGKGDLCDNCVSVSNVGQLDSDSDLVGNACDNCADLANRDQLDSDRDKIGDVCEVVAPARTLPSYWDLNNDNLVDTRADSVGPPAVTNLDSACAMAAFNYLPLRQFQPVKAACGNSLVGSRKIDFDCNGRVSLNEMLETIAVITQGQPISGDLNTDTIPDCTLLNTDSDGIAFVDDNCPTVSNVDQADADSDGVGNVCDADYVSPAAAAPTGGAGAGTGAGQALARQVLPYDLNGDGCVNRSDVDVLFAEFSSNRNSRAVAHRLTLIARHMGEGCVVG